MSQAIFCLISMYQLDNYQFRLFDRKVNGDYEGYLQAFCQVDQQQLKLVRFYKWYYQQLPFVYTILSSWPSVKRISWANDHVQEFENFKILLDSFINDQRHFSVTFEVNEYEALKSIALKIASLFQF